MAYQRRIRKKHSQFLKLSLLEQTPYGVIFHILDMICEPAELEEDFAFVEKPYLIRKSKYDDTVKHFVPDRWDLRYIIPPKATKKHSWLIKFGQLSRRLRHVVQMYRKARHPKLFEMEKKITMNITVQIKKRMKIIRRKKHFDTSRFLFMKYLVELCKNTKNCIISRKNAPEYHKYYCFKTRLSPNNMTEVNTERDTDFDFSHQVLLCTIARDKLFNKHTAEKIMLQCRKQDPNRTECMLENFKTYLFHSFKARFNHEFLSNVLIYYVMGDKDFKFYFVPRRPLEPL